MSKLTESRLCLTAIAGLRHMRFDVQVLRMLAGLYVSYLERLPSTLRMSENQSGRHMCVGVIVLWSVYHHNIRIHVTRCREWYVLICVHVSCMCGDMYAVFMAGLYVHKIVLSIVRRLVRGHV